MKAETFYTTAGASGIGEVITEWFDKHPKIKLHSVQLMPWGDETLILIIYR